MRKTIAVFLLVITLSTITVFAHPGRTDSDGGHNGPNGYHYHHGYPAHQHDDGTCPYNFDDATGSNRSTAKGSGSDGNSKNSRQNDNTHDLVFGIVAALVGTLFFCFLIANIIVLCSRTVYYKLMYNKSCKVLDIIAKKNGMSASEYLDYVKKAKTTVVYRNPKTNRHR